MEEESKYDANMKEIRALISASEARHELLSNEIKAKQDLFAAEFRGEIRNLNTKIEGVIDTFSVAIADIKDNQSYTLAKFAIILGIVQVVVSVILHFWK